MSELPLRGAAFKEVIAGTAGDKEHAKVQALGLQTAALDRLSGRLQVEFSCEHYGYPNFSDSDEHLVRAIASNRLRSAAAAVGRNLIEARLHEHEIHRVVGPNGLAFPSEATLGELVERDLLEMHVVGFFQSVGSALDCLAATYFGATSMPVSLVFADFDKLLRFDPNKPPRSAGPVPDPQRALWQQALVHLASASGEPSGWLRWAVLMRNALLHRGRNVTMLRNRRNMAPVIVDSRREPHTLLRYDPHLNRRPWLDEIQSLLRFGAEGLGDVWLAESVQETVTETRIRLNAFCESSAAWIEERWADEALQRSLVTPTAQWCERQPDLDFQGFGGGTLNSDSAMVSTSSLELFKLVKRLDDEGKTPMPE